MPQIGNRRVRMYQVNPAVVTHIVGKIPDLKDPSVRQLKNAWHDRGIVSENFLEINPQKFVHLDPQKYAEIFQGLRGFEKRTLSNLTAAVLARCVLPLELPQILEPLYGDHQRLVFDALGALRGERIPDFNRLKQRLIEAGYQLCLDGLDFSQREVRLEELDFSFITLRKSIFSGRTLVRGKLEESDASEAVFEQTVFNHVNLHGLNAAGAKFTGAQFLNCCSLFLMKVSEKTVFRRVNFVDTMLGPKVRSNIFINCRGSVWLPEGTEAGLPGFRKIQEIREHFPWPHLPHQTFVKWVAE